MVDSEGNDEDEGHTCSTQGRVCRGRCSTGRVSRELLVDKGSNQKQMQQVSGKTDLPQLHVDGQFKCLCQDLEDVNEDGAAAVLAFLGLS